MITELPQAHAGVLGFSVAGDVTKSDYTDVLVPAVQKAIDADGSVKLFLDLTGFRWEKVDAWGDDLHFGHEYHRTIQKMAIVGDHTWESWLTRLAQPFYAVEAHYFSDDAAAWSWLAS